MSDLDISAPLAGLLSALSAAERRALAARMARELRQAQQRRIASQVNPDGTPYAPRKPRLRTTGRVRRGMFTRIRTAQYLRTSASAEAAAVQFTGRVARIARIHQYGLHDQVAPKGPRHRYPVRQLLGFSRADLEQLTDRITAHLASRLNA